MLARIEAECKGADYAIMLDQFGYVAKVSLTDIIVVKGGTAYASYAASALEGVSRGLLLSLLPENGVPALEKNLTLQDLWTAIEVFIYETGTEIRSIVKIDGRQIGEGGLGPVIRKAIRVYKSYIEEHGEPIEYKRYWLRWAANPVALTSSCSACP